MRCHSAGLLFAAAAALPLGLATPAAAQVRAISPVLTRVSLSNVSCPRIADPKLAGASIPISYVVQPPGVRAHVSIGITQNGRRIATIYSGDLIGSDLPRVLMWDGRFPNSGGATEGDYIDPGSYGVEVVAGAS